MSTLRVDESDTHAYPLIVSEENYDPAIFKNLFIFSDFGGKYVLIEKNEKYAFLGYNEQGFNMIILKKSGVAVHVSDLKGLEEQDWKWKKRGDYIFEITTSDGKNVGTLKME
jgi:hypothetical protein